MGGLAGPATAVLVAAPAGVAIAGIAIAGAGCCDMPAVVVGANCWVVGLPADSMLPLLCFRFSGGGVSCCRLYVWLLGVEGMGWEGRGDTSPMGWTGVGARGEEERRVRE